MVCPYAHNSFCASLSPALRKTLCGCCSKVRYPAGNILNRYSWNDTLAVLADGFVISAAAGREDDGSFVPQELIGSGHFLNIPQGWSAARWENVSSFVILDSVVALFDRACVDALFRADIDFVRAICEGYITGYRDLASAFQEIGGGDAQSAVRYVLEFCRARGIPQLTHAQIALATGLTRPTVTKTIHGLLKKERETSCAGAK